MSVEQDIAAFRHLIEDGFGRGDLSVADEVVAADCVEHQQGLRPGPDGVKDAIARLHRWFEDFDLRVEEVAVLDGMLWARNRGSGTNTGRVLGHEPTGRRMEIYVFDQCRFENGKIVEHWGVPDQLGMLMQLGIVAPPQRPAAAAETR